MIEKLSIGTAQFGLDYGINNKVGCLGQNEINKILDIAYKNNIRSIDTAKAYGKSEERVGNFLKSKNHKWEIVTKINNLDIKRSRATLSRRRSVYLFIYKLDPSLNYIFFL